MSNQKEEVKSESTKIDKDKIALNMASKILENRLISSDKRNVKRIDRTHETFKTNKGAIEQIGEMFNLNLIKNVEEKPLNSDIRLLTEESTNRFFKNLMNSQ